MRANLPLFILCCFLLSACTQKAQHINATLNEAFLGFADADKSQQELQTLPYASSYVTIDNNAQLFIVLALAEPSPQDAAQIQLKWLSADRAMLTTENGRLVKTLRFPKDNISGISALNSIDPLRITGKKPDQQQWTAIYDWQPDYRFNYTANLTWKLIGEQRIHSPLWDKQTDYYQELVSIPSLNVEFTNHFWLDKISHQVVKSIQRIGPEMSSVEMLIVKPFAG